MAGLVAITFAAFTISGLVTARSMTVYLTNQAESELTAAQGRLGHEGAHAPTDGDNDTAQDQDDIGALLRVPGSVLVLMQGDAVQRVIAVPEEDDDHVTPTVSAADIATLNAVPANIATPVELSGHPYLATQYAGPGAEKSLVAIPTHEISETVAALTAALAATFAVALLVIALVGWFLIKLSLRPLDRVAHAVRSVTTSDLAHGTVELDRQLPKLDDRTEVGQVAHAFEDMIAHVETSLNAREDSERRKSQFVADAGHELRTPLATIRGYAELMRQSSSSGFDLDPAWPIRIEDAAARMGLLVDDLLMLANLDEGRPLHREHFDVGESVTALVADAIVTGPTHQWRDQLAEEPLVVEADRALIEQLLANLLANARVHTPAGTSVVVRAHSRDGKVVIGVEDNGPGIPPELIPSVTDRFARADASRSRARGGSGLGLAIATSIAQACDGELVIYSPVVDGRGTRVEVVLPRVANSQD